MKQSCQTRQRIGSILVAVGIAAGTGLAVNPPANAGPLVTIYPNYGNQHCGPGGWVRAVQVSAFLERRMSTEIRIGPPCVQIVVRIRELWPTCGVHTGGTRAATLSK